VHFKALFLAETRRGHSLPRSAKRRISKALDLIHKKHKKMKPAAVRGEIRWESFLPKKAVFVILSKTIARGSLTQF